MQNLKLMGGLCMKVRLIQNDFQTTDVYLIEENKTLLITFAGNGDLYWVIQNKACGENVKYSSDYFDISKDNVIVFAFPNGSFSCFTLLILIFKPSYKSSSCFKASGLYTGKSTAVFIFTLI